MAHQVSRRLRISASQAIHAVPLRLALAALALLVLAPIAFWPAYLSKLRVAEPYTHLHAALGTCWLLLLLVQPLLVMVSLRARHRILGRVGVLVGAAFFVSGILVAHRGIARMSLDQFTREGRFVYLPLAMAAVFGASLLLAIAWRRSAMAHARFMAATALPLLDPVLARLLFFHAPPLPFEQLYQVPAFALSITVLVAMLASLHPTVPGRRSFQYFALGVAALMLGFFFIPSTAPWLSFVTWFRSLPLT
jgi:hypothetical protein